MRARRYRRHFPEKIEDRDPNVMWMEEGTGYIEPYGDRYAAVGDRLIVIRNADILLQARIIRLGQRVHRGQLIAGTTPAWAALREELLINPPLIEMFPVWHRKFEEFVAGGYFAARWSDVTLSPSSRDGGFDVAARKRGRQILDEMKAFSSKRRVGHQIVRAAVGLLREHTDVDQVRVTTTSWFAPTISEIFRHLIPESLLLRDRHQLFRWLRQIGCRPN